MQQTPSKTRDCAPLGGFLLRPTLRRPLSLISRFDPLPHTQPDNIYDFGAQYFAELLATSAPPVAASASAVAADEDSLGVRAVAASIDVKSLSPAELEPIVLREWGSMHGGVWGGGVGSLSGACMGGLSCCVSKGHAWAGGSMVLWVGGACRYTLRGLRVNRTVMCRGHGVESG